MVYYVSIGTVLLIVLLLRLFVQPSERCPDCGSKREGDHPICECGWVFEYPDDSDPLEYGDPDESEQEYPTPGI